MWRWGFPTARSQGVVGQDPEHLNKPGRGSPLEGESFERFEKTNIFSQKIFNCLKKKTKP
jgi:hypothetical protein